MVKPKDDKPKGDNLFIYNATKTVPPEAQKEIRGGRLAGKTDINPMWRIKKLTELFGPCGIGWKYVILKQWTEEGAKNEVSAFINIELYIKVDGEWSDAIPGTGGNAFVANEKNGLYTSDECYKMALTDAISVACKALGVGADVYWEKDRTKYTQQDDIKPPANPAKPADKPDTQPVDRNKPGSCTMEQRTTIKKLTDEVGYNENNYEKYKKMLEEFPGAKTTKDLSIEQADQLSIRLSEIKEGLKNVK